MIAIHNPSVFVLVIEPDETLANQLAFDLQEAGYDAIVAHDAVNGLEYCGDACGVQNRNQPALIVIDRMLIGESGLSLCKNIRNMGNRSPVLILMARDTIDDRIACLDAGANDYILKPYRSEDFLKLIHLYLKPDLDTTEQLRFGDLVLDIGTRRAIYNSKAIDLTMKEFELLKFLMEHPREVLSREQILENVWGYDFMGESNVIEVYVRYLRLKIEEQGQKRLIQTVRGVGYVLRES
ncbi:response regulator transcription factor [Dolichospermum circinale CS-537/01]|uniref:Response regulator transcription factor n=1 Tax=Dolichospermum circinale CS-537/01 TaxID=3021739 RepID=A0ABT5A9S7_9CYAN|nr:response regulator transcription factor [Dolichospermum circinale]MDB9488721.1 response regulator transcription factor [Dolichospermum circinale CS-537/01]